MAPCSAEDMGKDQLQTWEAGFHELREFAKKIVTL
jgi:hypothetical protein